MEKIRRYWRFVRNGSMQKLIRTVIRTLWYNGRQQVWKLADGWSDSNKLYRQSRRGLCPVCMDRQEIDVSGIPAEYANELWRSYAAHRFDLLGSGWVQNSFVSDCPGMDGYHYGNGTIATDPEGLFLEKIMCRQNVPYARKVFAKIEGAYEPIDWQKDFKSGYRWGADRWYRPQETARKPGGDIKVPWELSRLQHLPRLAVLAQVLTDARDEIYREFRNQLLDFIAQNPVRRGVNHMCTMDVGIRVANIALACSLWKSMGCTFDREFETIVTNYLFNECAFIRNNLEWSYYLTSNHYFADIAGLLWGSAVLPKCRKRERWLCFAKKQLVNEIRKQFHAEGSNGEGSTAYHRLTGEMAIYSVALLRYLELRGEVSHTPQDIYDIMYRAGCFTNDITRPDKAFTQIGDNDSGLFFKLSVTGNIGADGELHENLNDGRPYVSAVWGMFGGDELSDAAVCYPLESSVVGCLRGKGSLCYTQQVKAAFRQTKRSAPAYEKEYVIGSEGVPLLPNIHRIDYPDFGICIFRSDHMYLCVNLSDNGQKGNAGHAHNDKLSFELFIDDQCIFEDPGTYVYTPLPDMRDRFRSTRYHNTVYCGEEQNRYNGMFSMCNDTRCSVIELQNDLIEARVEYRGIVHERRIEITQTAVKITDRCNRAFEQQFEQQPVARGYGRLEK